MSAAVVSLPWLPLPIVIAVGGMIYICVAVLLGAVPSEDMRTARRTVGAALHHRRGR
jgi:hypothetical protein